MDPLKCSWDTGGGANLRTEPDSVFLTIKIPILRVYLYTFFTPSSLNLPSWLSTASILFQSLLFVSLTMVCLKSPSVFNAHGFQCFLRVLCLSRFHYFLYISLITALILPLAPSPLCTHILFLSVLSHGRHHWTPSGVIPSQLLSGTLQSASKSHILLCTFTAQKNPTLYHGCVYISVAALL